VEATRRVVAAAEAGVEAFERAVAAAQAARADAQQQERQVPVQQWQTDALRAAQAQAEANAAAAAARFGQTRILAPASGIVTLRAARQGEVVNPGSPIVTLFDLSSTWVDADVEETYADLIAMGETLRVRLPSGTEVSGPVIYKRWRPILPRSATSAAPSATSRRWPYACACPIPRGSSRWA